MASSGSGGGGRHRFGAPGDPPCLRAGDEIVIAGRLYHTGTKVVTWLDPGGFNAYECMPPLPARGAPGAPPKLPEAAADVSIPVPRYGKRKLKLNDTDTQRPPAAAEGAVAGGASGEKRKASDPTAAATTATAPAATVSTAAELESVLDKIVVHYDGCGTSAKCFRVLHHERGLSCHFLIDGDGVVYQTLDVLERAWHATTANDSSVGFELAHVGAFSNRSNCGDHPKKGNIQGQELFQTDFTNEQYDALARVAATLMARFPKIPNAFPRRSHVTDALVSRYASAHLRMSSEWHTEACEERRKARNEERSDNYAVKSADARLEAGEMSREEYDTTLVLCDEADVEEDARLEASDPWHTASDEYCVDPTIAVVPRKLDDGHLTAFRGVLGHYHVQTNKIDPGPAFDWARLHARIADLLADADLMAEARSIRS
jgi:N-acetylmuramoyl-L-alanine amidase